MRVILNYEIKDFDELKAKKALSACEKLCEDCDLFSLEDCLLSSTDCPVKNAVEALRSLIRIGMK